MDKYLLIQGLQIEITNSVEFLVLLYHELFKYKIETIH